MVIISNSQRDQILRFLDRLCNELQGSDTRTFNTRRLAKNLAKKLREKRSVSADELHCLTSQKTANNCKQ